jgi:glycosyltransferase involved in cell wall biosynthesis
MKLGFFPVLDPQGGGIYQYSGSIARALDDVAAGGAAVAFVPPGHRLPREMDRWTRFELDDLAPAPAAQRLAFITSPRLRRGLRSVRRRVRPDALVDLDAVRSRPESARRLRELGVDLDLFPAPLPISFEIGLPYVMAIHDLQHRLQPEFPEVSAGGVWEYREHLFRNGTRRASAVLADSEVGREDILDAYGDHVEEERVCVLPFVAPPELREPPVDEDAVTLVRQRYVLPERYLLYPAQFWPHKNHVRLVEALGILAGRNVHVPLVLCGTWKDEIRRRTYKTMMNRAAALGIAEQLTVLGYVPETDMAALYRGATGLVFPTFFGPTNIPVVEAWTVGCPVITSDIHGIREQVGDAALLADPREPEAIAAAVERLWTDAALAEELVRKGHARVGRFSPDDFRRRLTEILERARELGPPVPSARTYASHG